MKLIYSLCLFLIFGVLFPCYIHSEEANSTDTVDPKIVSANTSFGFNLFKDLIKETPDKNMLISPISINLALEMTYNGANGETRKAMSKALELNDISIDVVNQSNSVLVSELLVVDDKAKTCIGNSIWANRGITLNFGFIKLVENSYNARVSNLDFSHPLALKAINGWISDQTDGKITRIVDKLDNNVVLYLINAVYFKGYWTKAFNKENTKDAEFILANGSKKMVPMMSQTNLVKYYQEKSFEAISLLYGNGKISMYIFVPSADSNLIKFVSNLNVNNWENWIANFREITAKVVLPKFRIGYETVLNDNLKELGMGIAFGSEADFGGICRENVFISEVKHKTFMEVNEEGTEAGAATSVAMKKNGTPKIVVNRPFFCAIRDNTTGSILFMGYVVDPAGDVIAPSPTIKTKN